MNRYLYFLSLVLLIGCTDTFTKHERKTYHDAVIEEAWYGHCVSPHSTYQLKVITQEEGRIMINCYNRKLWRTVKVGDKVNKGDLITDGSADIDEVFEFGGAERAKDYVIGEIAKIYELQGETVARKHIEIIVKQMFSRRRVESAGDSNLAEGMIVDDMQLQEENDKVKEKGGSPAKALPVVMGITKVSLSRKSFLSAASFQDTTKVLINSAVRGGEDDLVGLMENVIIGRLIPAGSGFMGSAKQRIIEAVQPKEEDMY